MSSNQSGSGGGNGFKPLGLSDDVFRGIVRLGFRNPTPVQRKALPVIMSGADSVVMARTGSGKTAAFLIPLLESLIANGATTGDSRRGGVRGIVLSPTRELSLQTLRVLRKMSHFMPEIRSIGIHGGEGMERQFDELASKPDIIVATPGRLAHILSEIPDFTLRDCQMCILDEADRLLEMGFAVQLRQIHKSLPEQRCQRVLLSATMPKMLVEFTKSGFTNDPQVVRLDQEATVSEELRISFITCRSLEKDAALLQILSAIEEDKEANSATRTGLTLIFCATRHHVEYVTTLIRSSGLEATLIYGTLDADARNSNLASFRNGRKPIMVVTDVAARGVDVPMCDHVIHYHFPPTPKLFVHRSGRVARAGRIGFCFGLVEPDELPYMVDLHLFLGRKLTTSEGITKTNEDGDISHERDDTIVEAYSLNEMTPDMVHYGSIPESILTLEVENVRRIMDSEMAGSDRAESMKSLSRVCTNAMKQYRKTRPEASKEGVRRAKAILEGTKLQTGQRVGGASIPPHPLLRGMELEKYEHDKSKGKIGTLNGMENIRKRQEFLKAVSQFRPKETIFEAFATGGGKETGVLSQVDKGRTIASSKKNDTSFALSAMKNMRRQMRMARDKGATLVVAGSSLIEENRLQDSKHSDAGVDVDDDADDGSVERKENATGTAAGVSPSVSLPLHDSRPRLSKAERRRLKKNPSATPSASSLQAQEKRKKNMRGSDFRDNTYFIQNEATTNPEEAHRQRTVEAAMQPSAASAMKGIVGNALRLEEAMLDVVGDENEQMVQKQRMMRWDKSKRKYIQTSVGAELSGQSRSKRIKLESGQVVKSDKLKLGEIYEKWQKKTNRSVGRDGVFDNAADDGDDIPSGRGGNKKRKKGKGGSHGADSATSAKAIKKSRESKQDLKLKNMKKADRKRLERNSRSEQIVAKGVAKKGSQGKKGMSGRWKK
ncbi:ATP-dependent RNA helicase [Nitzschia inconspicua]|uniref:RNA helicase n=1 Tax=Nitzschia inconspicua TaxID=303405 RepID=A0A9K3Q052_9STRA|nr:ATP-dependent RNA helicase [Nitzschia inconspicua]KAG7366163.1 ATP-dependent RNA helicase [Nitzschia inconspicua]